MNAENMLPSVLFSGVLGRMEVLKRYLQRGLSILDDLHNPVVPRMVECREKVLAFAMGLHPRLGDQVSPLNEIGPASSRLCACLRCSIARSSHEFLFLRKIRLGQDSRRRF